MKMSIEDYKQKLIIDDITRMAYIDAGGQIPDKRPAPDPNFKPIPTKNTEMGENLPPCPDFKFFNNEARQAKAEHMQGLLNRLAREH